MNDYNFGNFVCYLRETRGLTQADLARQLGVTPAAISKWENGSSKPRVEVLFQLAEILGVRPEELMAGRYLEKEKIDPESVRIINEKYEYLRRIELHNTAKTKIFRLIAAVIDWNIIGAITMLSVVLFMAVFLAAGASLTGPAALLLMLLILSYPVCFMLKDLLFGGRSLGKRIMGLTVLDKTTGKVPKKTVLFLRNIFLIIAHVEAIVMLITGLTLGDRAAHTVVVRKKDLDLSQNIDPVQQNTDMINQYASNQTARARSKKKQAILWISIIVAVLVLFVGFVLSIINASLNAMKNTEEYKIAYAYVIESDRVRELGIEEEQLKFTSFSKGTRLVGEGTQRFAEFSFRVSRGHDLTVILHDEGNGWYVCEECTKFD